MKTNEGSELDELAPWLVLLITLVGGALRAILLAKNGMWLDEAFSVWLANHSVAEILQWIGRIDQHPPLYYLLLHSWITVNGDSPYYARLLSVLFGAATIPVIYLIGKCLSGTIVGLAAAALLACSPFNIYFAQETRMYTLLMFNAAVAICALAWLLTTPSSVRPIGSQFREYVRAWRTAGPVERDTRHEFSYRDDPSIQTGWRGWIYRHRWSPIKTIEADLAWIAFIVFSAATLLSHNTAVFFVLATNSFVLGLMLFRRLSKSGSQTALQAPSLANWVIAQVAIFVLWSPWLLTFVGQARWVDQEFWIPKPTWDSVNQTLRYLSNSLVPTQASQTVMWVLLAVLCLGLLYYRKRFSIFVFLAALFAVPFLGELLVSLRRPIFSDRTLIWVTIPLFLLLASGIARLKFRPVMVVALAVLVSSYLLSDGDYYRFVGKEDWKTPAGYVANYAQRDDLVLFNSNFVVIPFDYYFKSYEDFYGIQVQKVGVPADLYGDGILEPKMTSADIPKLLSLVSGHNRVWLVYSHNDYTDPEGLIPQTLASQMKLTQTRDFYGGHVQLYETQ